MCLAEAQDVRVDWTAARGDLNLIKTKKMREKLSQREQFFVFSVSIN